MTKADNAFKEWLITSPCTTLLYTCFSSLVSYTYIQIIPRLTSFCTYKTMVSTDIQQAPSDIMNLQIQFWASGNNDQKRNSNSGKCKRGHVLLFTSHQIFREKFPIQGDGSTFFGKCTHSYETKAVLLQEYMPYSAKLISHKKSRMSVEFKQEQLSKKITNLFQFCSESMIKKSKSCFFGSSFCVFVFHLPWGIPLLQRLNISHFLLYQIASDLIGLGAWWKALNKLKSGAKWHLILTIL